MGFRVNSFIGMTKNNPKITMKVSDNRVRIYFNGLLHLRLPYPKLTFQSWVDPEESRWHIEYYTCNQNTVATAYDSFYKWESILSLLDKIH